MEPWNIMVDDADNISRVDLACVWGNCLMPCVLVGDPKQLPPTIMSAGDVDDTGFF